MAIEFVFRIDQDKLHMSIPLIHYHLEFHNLVVYRKKDGFILAMGESRKKVRSLLGEKYAAAPDEIVFRPVFNADESGLRFEISFLKYCTQILHRRLQIDRPRLHFFAKLRDQFDYVLQIEGYEVFPEARRNALEQSLQAHLRIRKLVVNGRSVGIPLWKRNLEYWMRRLLVTVAPLAMLVAGYFSMPAGLKSEPFLFLAYLLLFVYATYFLGKILWSILARTLVPRDYFICVLTGGNITLSGANRLLANIVWGHDR